MNRSLTTLLLLLMMSYAAFAQPSLNFKRVTVNWPTIELYFTAGCNGSPASSMTKQDFKIFENGVEVKDFTLWCPDPTIGCAISVAMVFDASGSMSGSGNAGAKLAGHSFVDLMDGVLDEAEIIFFAEFVTIQQQMTTIKPMLHSAIDALPAGPANTGVWDGIYAGIIELINNGVNQCRAVIVLSDGIDTRSTRTVAEVITLANRHSIHVFTIGLGTGINATELELIAVLTGGRYYQTPNAGQLAAIYTEISTPNQDCIITYDRDCADGAMRTVELQLRNFCGGTDVKLKTYRPPLDSTAFSNLYMELGDAEGKGGTDVKVPLNLVTPIADELFYPFTFTLLFDPQCLQFKGVTTPPGSLLQGVPLTVTPVSGGVQIATSDRKLLNGNGTLMEFTFRGVNPQDTTCCDVSADSAGFEQGCFIPIIEPGEVCILPRKPVVNCTIDAPREVIWQGSIKDYTPNPFPVTMRIFNTGDKEATNVRFKIDYNASDVELVSPLSDVQTGTPKDLQPGEYTEVIWVVAAKRRTNGDSTEFCITASFDNHPDVTCCVKTYIPPTGPSVNCTIDAPREVIWQGSIKDYTPNPFPVLMRIYNTGDKEATNVRYKIDYDTANIQLVSPISDEQTGASNLQAGTYTEVVWQVAAKRRTNGDSTEFCITASFDNHPDVTCCIKTYIPPTGPSVNCTIDAPEIVADNANGRYNPMPFPVTVTVTNTGGMRTDTVFATITLVGDLTLATGEQATKRLLPSLLFPNQQGQAQWMLRHPTTTEEKQYVIQVRVKTSNADSTLCEKTVIIPVMQNTLAVRITPDGPTTFCEGEEVVLDAGTGFSSYNWSTGATTQKITITASGSYWVTVGNTAGQSANSDTIKVNVLPLPPKPAISRQGDILLADNAATWQWLRDGNLIAGETKQFFAITDVGTYSVRVTNAEGCQNTSDPIIVSVLTLEEVAPLSFSFDVYPEPSYGNLYVRISSSDEAPMDIHIYTLLGSERYKRAIRPIRGSVIHEIDTRGWTKGVYFVRVNRGGQSIIKAVTIR
jgi:hypothetical protein